MKTGDIILIPFPYAEATVKVRPAVVVAQTADFYKDLILTAISSVVPEKLTPNEMIIQPDSLNNLRAISVIKIDRIVTLKAHHMIGELGQLSNDELVLFKKKFKELVN